MVPATDSAKKTPTRRGWFVFAVAALLCDPGCARLRSFRQADPTAFGTSTASAADSPADRPRSGDLYAERVGTAKAPGSADPALADNPRRSPASGSPAGEDASPDSPADAKGGPRIALQPPESLPALDHRPALAATRTQPPTPAAEPAAPAAEPAAPAGPTVGSLLAETRRALNGIASYQVKMNHQERINGRLNPAEDVVLSIRRNPQAVRLEWRDGDHKGREVLYAADANAGLMHVNMGDSRFPVPRLSIAPDSPLATRNSRHPITEAGYDTIVTNMTEVWKRQQANDPSLGRIRYEGLEQPEGLAKPAHKVQRLTPTGETWLVYLDPESHLPLLVQETAQNGDLLERYVFRDPTLNPPELAKAESFNPDSRWGPPKGLFQRMARSGEADGQDTKSR